MRRWITGPIVGLLALLAVFAVQAPEARADTRDFTLVNNSAVTIFYVYVSPSNTSDWEEDVLGSSVLLSGDSVNIVFNRNVGQSIQCSYDIKVIGSDGREGYLWAVDLCSTSTVTFR